MAGIATALWLLGAQARASSTPLRSHDAEVVAYISAGYAATQRSWARWPWKSVTTLVNSKGNGSAAIAEAHARGVRIIVNLGAKHSFTGGIMEDAGWSEWAKNLSDPNARHAAAAAVAAWVHGREGYDGAVLDLEGNAETNPHRV